MTKNILFMMNLTALLLFQSCNKGEDYFEKQAIAPSPIEVAELAPPSSVANDVDAPVLDNELDRSPADESVAPDDADDAIKVVVDDSVELCKDPNSKDLICNPLGGGIDTSGDVSTAPKSYLGLISRIVEGGSSFANLNDFIDRGTAHPEILYFSNFNIPTRSFTEGFGTADNYLKSLTGEKLTEWFAIFASGFVALPQNHSAGLYHIVTISDDGIRVKVGDTALISNPGVHSPTIDCSASLVDMQKDVEKKFELQYFQGPRTEIALVVMAKKVEDPNNFDLRQACSGGATVSNLEAKGYSIMSPAWFLLPLEYRK